MPVPGATNPLAIPVIEHGQTDGLGLPTQSAITVPFGTPPGVYQMTYRLCWKQDTSVCDDATVTVTVNDVVSPEVTITADDSPVDEGETAGFTLRLSQPAPATGLSVTVRLTQEGDHATETLPLTRTVTFTEGETTAPITVPTTDDGIDEPDGRIIATITDGGTYDIGTPSVAEVVIRDDDTARVTITADDSPVDEGGTAGFTLRLSQAAPATGLTVMVRLTQEGDHATETLPLTRTVTFSEDETTAPITVPTTDDGIDEPDGRIIATITDGGTYDIGTPSVAEVVIRDDDTARVTITADDSPVDEGGTAGFTLRLSQAAPDTGLTVTVRLTQEGDHATETLPLTRTVTFSGGDERASITVPTTDDGIDEPDGRIIATITDGGTYGIGNPSVAEVVIRDNDTAQVTISADDSPVDEGGTAGFTLRLSQPAPATGLTVMVRLTQEGDHATETLPLTRTVTFSEDDTTAPITVPTTDDGIDEPDGRIIATITDGGTYGIGNPSVAEVVVRDDDTAQVTITADDSPIDEGDTAGFTLRLSQPAPDTGLTVMVRLTQEGDHATETLPLTRTVTFTEGDITAPITVPTTDDGIDEPDGRIIATITDGGTYDIGTPSVAEVVIRDNDTAQVTISADDSPVDEGGTAGFTLRLSQPAPATGLSVTVRLTQEGDHATETLPLTRTVTFTEGDTTAPITVPTTDDGIDEPDGRIIATITTAPLITLSGGDEQDGRTTAITTGVSIYRTGDPSAAEVVVRDRAVLSPPEIIAGKSVDKAEVRYGDIITYQLGFRNDTAVAATGLVIRDDLPPGILYMPGTAQVDGVSREPSVTENRLSWGSVAIPPQTTLTVRFSARVTPQDGAGVFTNHTWAADSDGGRLSNVATATSRIIREHVFGCSGIIGKVFDDRNRNGHQDAPVDLSALIFDHDAPYTGKWGGKGAVAPPARPRQVGGEPGLAGVRIATVRGEWITTDAHGRYHVPCHALPQGGGSNVILKVDPQSLPSGYRLTTENPRVLRVTPGKMARINFGAALSGAVRIDLDAAAFVPGGGRGADGPVATEALAGAIGALAADPTSGHSVIRLRYHLSGEDRRVARARLASVEALLRDAWADHGHARLMIEREISRAGYGQGLGN